MTNAEARKLATDALLYVRKWRNPKNAVDRRKFPDNDTIALAEWCLARLAEENTASSLGQEEVMDAEVAEIEKRHEAHRDWMAIPKPMAVMQSIEAYQDVATLLKKLRAVTPAVTRDVLLKTIERVCADSTYSDGPRLRGQLAHAVLSLYRAV